MTDRLDGVLTYTEAARRSGLSRQRITTLCRNGRIAMVRLTTRWYVSGASLQRYLDSPRRPGRPRKEPTR
jgi:hypothetical protein